MNKKLLIFLFLLSSSVFAKPYPHPDLALVHNKVINTQINVRSMVSLSDEQINRFETVFNHARHKFLHYYGVKNCENGHLEIRVVSAYWILNNRTYFPGLAEESYAKAGEIVFGRYFRASNILYIIAPYNNIFSWDEDFSHELAHYFVDDCGRVLNGEVIISNSQEHEYIARFLNSLK